MNHVYYRLTIKLESPLSIGSGEGSASDSDVIKDGNGVPYIPGTSLAGLYRSIFSSQEKEELFGKIVGSNGNGENISSPIVVYDARLKKDSSAPVVSVRDSVKLDANKVDEEGAKFDFEIVETGAEFISFIEIKHDSGVDESILEKAVNKILSHINNGFVTLGKKSTRGYGQISVKSQKAVFDFARREDIDKWLDFDIFHDANWEAIKQELIKEEDNVSEEYTKIEIPLKLHGGISIRSYTTDVVRGDTKNAPDYKQLTLHDKDGTPVIPGTSWAGAFRHRIKDILTSVNMDDRNIDNWFGFVDKENSTSAKSKIIFAESMLTNGTSKIITRNSIDRFSGATVKNALYTEKTYYNGETVLEIKLLKSEDLLKDAIFAAIADLTNGYLAIGGLTAVGRGIFKLNGDIKVNGENKTIEEVLS